MGRGRWLLAAVLAAGVTASLPAGGDGRCPDTPADAYRQGREAMDQGRWREAIQDLEQALRRCPAPADRVDLAGGAAIRDYYPYSLLARCHLELGENGAAAALLGTAAAEGEPAWVRDPVARRLPVRNKPALAPSRRPPPLPGGFWLTAGAGLAAWTALRFRRRRLVHAPGPPAALGPYRILRPLGHGGFATTYLARHRDTGRGVALKVLHPHRLQDPEGRSRFGREARLGARLDHPNLVRLLDLAGADSGWIALEYVPGPTLGAFLAERGRLPPREAAAIALAIAEAMAHAHARGVVHRDLKPANILLGADGPKVLDLGIARELDSASLTTTSAFLGTPRYTAPEAQVPARAGPAADRYSLGAMLFEMLAGRPPFLGETPLAVLDQHRRAPVPDLGELADVPPDLVRLVERLLAKDPDQRPGDPELVDRLRAFTDP
jgi:tetratricopeptide (TPR) repeat protein